MAKTISDEIIKTTIIVNGDQQKKALFDLEKQTRALTQSNKDLLLEKKRLERQDKTNTEEYKRLTAEIKQNNATIRENKQRMNELQREIGVTGLTMSQLSQRAAHLKNVLRNLVPGSADFDRYQAELKAVNARMSELNGKVRENGFSFGKAADAVNRYQGIAVGIIATLTGVVLSIQKVLDINGKLSDAQSKVAKTTGMNKKEVDELTKSFGLLKTRTQRIDLLGIAEIGGRLGIAKEEIGSFVEVMNKANVALGDSFEGGPEVVAEKLGRIKGLFEELRNQNVEPAFESVGSALNDLGNAGTASEENVADFVTRVGALPEALKPGIATALGLGAAFEESGLKGEIAATNYGKVVTIAARDFPKFAQVMRISSDEAKNLLNTDPTEFFFRFAKSLDGLDATKLAETLDYLKLNDNEVKMVLGAASQNVEMFREKIDLAANSMGMATSLTREYNIQNNNLQATIEKINKTVAGFFSSETMVSWLSSAFEWFAKFIGATEDADGSVANFRDRLLNLLKVLTIIVVSYISYNAAIKLTVLWSRTLTAATTLLTAIENRNAIGTGVLRSAKILLSAAYYTLTGNVGKATAAMRLFNMVSRMNPLGLVLGLLAGAAAAFIAFSESGEKAKETIRSFSNEAEVHAEMTDRAYTLMAKASTEYRSKVEPLIALLKNQDVSLATRKKAYEDLIAISPEFVGTVDAEFMATEKLNQVYADLLKNMDDRMRMQAMRSVIEDTYKAHGEAIKKVIELETELAEKQRLYEKTNKNARGEEARERLILRAEILNLQDELLLAKEQELNKNKSITILNQTLTKDVEKLRQKQSTLVQGSKEWLAIQSKINVLLGTTASNSKPAKVVNAGVDIVTDEQKRKKEEAARKAAEAEKKRLDELNKAISDRLQAERDAEDALLATMEEGYQKQYQLEQANYRRKLEDLRKALISEADIKKAEQNVSNTALSENERHFWEEQAKEWKAKNKAVYSQIESERFLHERRLGTIAENGARALLEKQQKDYDAAKIQREIDLNNQLAALGNNEKEKERLRAEYNARELEIEAAQAQKLIDTIKQILTSDNFQGIDLTLLTPQQRAEMEKQIEELKKKLSELGLAKAEVAGQGSTDPMAGMQDLGLNTNVDILGFTPENWDRFFTNLATGKDGLESMMFAAQGLLNMYAQYDSFLTASENATIRREERNNEKKKRRLKQQLDAGIINQTQYTKGVEKLDVDLDKKKADIEYKQAKRQKIIAAGNVLVSTAQAIMSIWAQVPKFDFGVSAGVLTGIVSALGAVQLAMVMKTPLPARGYEEGLYPDYVQREQDGKMFRASYGGPTRSGMVNKPKYFLAGERGPEMVIDDVAWRQMSPQTQDLLIRELRGIKGFGGASYQQGQIQVPPTDPEKPTGNDPELMMALMGIISENTQVMRELNQKGVRGVFSEHDYQSLDKLRKGLDKIDEVKNKAKF